MVDSTTGSPGLYKKQVKQAVGDKPGNRVPSWPLLQFLSSGSCSSSYFNFPQCWTVNGNMEAKQCPHPTYGAAFCQGVYRSNRKRSKTPRSTFLGHKICPSSHCIHSVFQPAVGSVRRGGISMAGAALKGGRQKNEKPPEIEQSPQTLPSLWGLG